METNKTVNISTSTDQGEAVGVIPLSALAAIPASNFSLEVDAYSFVNTNDGTTEYSTLGVYNHGNAVPLRFGLDPGDGIAYTYTGEDGVTNRNLMRIINPGSPHETDLGNFEDIPPGSIPGVNTCHPGVTCAANTPLGPQKMVSFSMNGYVISTFDNTAGVFSTGTLLLSESDPLNSVNTPDATGYKNMTVFDNVRLTILPEPASWLLIAMGSIAFARRWRRTR